MPWGKPHTYICIEPDCGAKFTSVSINAERCPTCREVHHNQRAKRRYREKRGVLFGKRREKKPLSEAARFNVFIARTWQSAICPECGKHMSVCRCCEPHVRHVEAVAAEMWMPWKQVG